jgi:hypothetical protein
MFQKACAAAIEGMTNGMDSERKRYAYVEFLSSFLAFMIALVILGFIGKLLWNNVMVELFSIAKPAKSFWQIVGLMILASLLRP